MPLDTVLQATDKKGLIIMHLKNLLPLSALLLLSGCSQMDIISEEPVFSDVTENSAVTEMSEPPAPESDVLSAEASDIPTITEPPMSETEAYFSSEATITAQNLLSSEGGNVIVSEYVQTYPQQAAEEHYTYTASYSTLNYKNQCAVWFSYLDYNELMSGKTAAEFEENICKSFDNVLSMGVNTVYLQVRAFGDSYYRSELYPPAEIFGGYDPLEIMVRCAHDRGLSVHAWINPMRLMTDDKMQALGDDSVIGKWYSDGRKNMFEYDGRLYLDPSSSEARSLICGGISEILTNYKVDGIQIDDYFYPCTSPDIDSEAYAASGSGLSLADWRRSNITDAVKQMYDTVHSANPEAVFGISPAGDPDHCRDEMYADVYKWCSEKGCCDYICPQLYYGLEHETAPFAEQLELWCGMTSDDIGIVAGLAAYKAGEEDIYAGSGKDEWIKSDNVLSEESKLASSKGCGTAYFRYGSLFD